MKNYELIAELNKYPAGHEIVFNSIIDTDRISSMPGDANYVNVSEKIKCVEVEENQIILC